MSTLMEKPHSLEVASRLMRGYRYCMTLNEAKPLYAKLFAAHYAMSCDILSPYIPFGPSHFMPYGYKEIGFTSMMLKEIREQTFLRRSGRREYIALWRYYEKAGCLNIHMWLSSTVVDMLQDIWRIHLESPTGSSATDTESSNRLCETIDERYELMGVLGDALQDAGCGFQALLDACYAVMPEYIKAPNPADYRIMTNEGDIGMPVYRLQSARYHEAMDAYRRRWNERRIIRNGYMDALELLAIPFDEGVYSRISGDKPEPEPVISMSNPISPPRSPRGRTISGIGGEQIDVSRFLDE